MSAQNEPIADRETVAVGNHKPRYVVLAATWPLIWLILATVIAMLPVLRSPLVPLTDYPGHIARLYVLSHLDHYVGTYVAVWLPYANLAMDGFILSLAHWMSILTAGHILVVTTLILLTASVAALQIVLFKRIGAISLVTPLLLYNHAFFLGLLGYLLTLSVALLGIAGWIASRNWHRFPRTLLFAAVALLLYLGHLFAFGVFALVITVMAVEECWRFRRITQLAETASVLLPAMLLLLFGPMAGQAGETRYGGWSSRFREYAAITDTYYSTIDHAALGFLIALFALGFATRRLSIAPQMRWPLAATFLAAVAMPDVLLDALAVSLRLPIALAFLTVGASTFRRAPTKVVLAIGAVASSILLAQVYSVGMYWNRVQDDEKELLATLSTTPLDHARLLVVIDPMLTHPNRSASGQRVILASYAHMADLVVLNYAVYLPSVFALSDKQPLRGIGSFAKFSQHDQPQLHPIDLEQALDGNGVNCAVAPDIKPYCGWNEEFDYVLYLDFGWRQPLLPRYLDAVAKGSFFVLYKVRRE